MKITRRLLKICKIIFIGFFAALILFNVIGIFKRAVLKEQIPLVFGYGNAVIITGSMEPEILPGDMIIVRKQNDYAIDDIVTYQGNNSPITHRIMEKTPNGYITQGDANNTDDGEITEERIIGKVVKIIPKVGTVVLFFQSTPGVLILIAGLFAIVELPALAARIRKYYREKKEKTA